MQELLSAGRASRAEAHELCRRFLVSRWRRWRVARLGLPRARRPEVEALLAWHELVRERLDSSAAEEDPGALERLVRVVERVYEGAPDAPLGVALEHAVRLHQLPALLLRGPLEERRRAAQLRTFQTRDALLSHARALAAPEGRLLLACLGLASERNELHADALAAALQLVTWLASFETDLGRGRLHFAIEDLTRHGLSIHDLDARLPTERTRALVRDQIAWARALFAKGWPLVEGLGRARGRSLAFLLRWHAATLSALEARGHDPFRGPPPSGWPRLLACASASAVSAGPPRWA